MLKSGETGDVIWSRTLDMAYSPQASSSGNPLADLLAMAVVAVIEKAAPSYIPLTQQANAMAIYEESQGFPAGPYDPNHMKDSAAF